MPKTRRAHKFHQLDRLITNLRWLLVLVAGGLGAIDTILNPPFELLSILPQILLVAIGALYNLAVQLLLYNDSFPHFLRWGTTVFDALLALGFFIAAGRLGSPLLLTLLFPILAAALRFPWFVPFIGAIVAPVVGGTVALLTTPTLPPTSEVVPFVSYWVILVLTSLLGGVGAQQVRERIKNVYLRKKKNELKRLRTAQEQSQLIFELASTLSATLNYERVLEAMLEVSDAGMRELGYPEPSQVSLVLLFSRDDLRIVASRHLTQRDQRMRFEGKEGALAQSLTRAEIVVLEDPGSDPELGQLVAMHSCREAIVLPLRAGFESFGAAVFATPNPNTYTKELRDLLIAICNQAIVALQNAQLYQSLIEEKERIVEVEEDARKKLARDLHDGPTQSIAAIAMRLNYARMILEKKADVNEAIGELQRIEHLARRTTKEIRHMLFTLRPLILETQGLQAALEQYINKLTDTYPTPIHLKITPNIDQLLDQNTQGVIFYILEEAIGNARKNAEADNIWVRTYVKGDTFFAEVEDDGCGFDVEEVQSSYDERSSLGMINMYERAELIDGDLSITSAIGEGTKVTLAVPMNRRRP